jgi:hypothetical protein
MNITRYNIILPLFHIPYICYNYYHLRLYNNAYHPYPYEIWVFSTIIAASFPAVNIIPCQVFCLYFAQYNFNQKVQHLKVLKNLKKFMPAAYCQLAANALTYI